jgi:hypothetical protein
MVWLATKKDDLCAKATPPRHAPKPQGAGVRNMDGDYCIWKIGRPLFLALFSLSVEVFGLSSAVEYRLR